MRTLATIGASSVLLFLVACTAPSMELSHDPLEQLYDPHVIVKRGEALFEREAYAQARSEYLYFLDLFPAHRLTPYVRYRVGLSFAAQFQGPDLDPTPIKQARGWFAGIVRDYPGTTWAMDAKEQVRVCDEHIAAVHAFVGRFYMRRGAYRAAMARFETIVWHYQGTQATDEALAALDVLYHTQEVQR